jgi:hypothetical protein
MLAAVYNCERGRSSYSEEDSEQERTIRSKKGLKNTESVFLSPLFASCGLSLLRRWAEMLTEIIRQFLDLIIREIFGPASLTSHRFDQS